MEPLHTQYIIQDNTYIPAGPGCKTLPAGFYNLQSIPGAWGLTPAKPVSDDLIDIPGTPADEMMIDITKFLSIKDLFSKAGLTHKRGYLIHGPQGTGKTSVALMAAQRFIAEFDAVVCYVPSAAHLTMMTDVIRKVEPDRPSMYLMEEADGFLNDTRALSILDGELSMRGAIFMAMTNHREKLPPRIANRPGRFDRVIYMGAPPGVVQREYLKRLIARIPEHEFANEGTVEGIVTGLDGIPLSMGHLREAFVSHVLMQVPIETIAARFKDMHDSVASAESETLEGSPWDAKDDEDDEDKGYDDGSGFGS